MNRADRAKWIEQELESRFDFWKIPQAMMVVKAAKKDQEYLINYFASRQSYKTMRVIEDGAFQDRLVIYVNI